MYLLLNKICLNYMINQINPYNKASYFLQGRSYQENILMTQYFKQKQTMEERFFTSDSDSTHQSSDVFIRRRTYLQNIQAEERFKINLLEQECSELQKQVQNLEQKLQDINRKNQQNREQTKVTHLKRITLLKTDIKNIVFW
ncbi:unnamed protein product [Paramecium primaurelia]|uniref:Uncharacterized protein n=1 Tax=Paramecium primaurelia TaxID=5886 RepID=A0A8S1PDU3_PARPR|nr:unnamed protein product [Paramecium primaurelia]